MNDSTSATSPSVSDSDKATDNPPPEDDGAPMPPSPLEPKLHISPLGKLIRITPGVLVPGDYDTFLEHPDSEPDTQTTDWNYEDEFEHKKQIEDRRELGKMIFLKPLSYPRLKPDAKSQ